MKTRTSISTSFLILFLAWSCQPESIDQKQARLNDLRNKHSALEQEIQQLEKEISGSNTSESSRKKVLVQAQLISDTLFEHFIEIHGVVNSDQNVMINSELAGLIQEVKVKEGQKVSRGQVIAVVNTDLIRQNIKELQTSLDLAKTVFDKQKRLWEQNVGTELQFLEAKSRKESLENSLSTLQTQLSKGFIKSPINGVVDEVFAKTGEMAAPAAPVARVVNMTQSEITADVSEAYLGKIAQGDEVEVEFPSMDKTVSGKIASIGSFINPGNRTFKIYITIGNSALLKPNMLTRVRFKDFHQKQALVVPSDIIQFDRNGNFLFRLIEKDNKLVASKTYIEVGPSYKGNTLITGKLSSGDKVIVKGHRSLTDGEEVKIKK